jgi:hypothetical protein
LGQRILRGWDRHVLEGGFDGCGSGSGFVAIFGEVAFPAAAAGLVGVELEHVAGDAVEAGARSGHLVDVGQHGLDDAVPIGGMAIVAVDLAVGGGEEVGVVVGGAANHGGVHLGALGLGLVEGKDAAVDFDEELGKVAFEAVDLVVAQGRDRAVVLGVEALEPGFAGMDGEMLAACAADDRHEFDHIFVAIAIVYANAVLDGHGQACRSDHGGDGLGDAIGLEHQAGSEVAALDAVAGAADVEVDAVVAPGFGEAGAVGEAGGVIAADLEDEGFFVGGEAEEPIEVAMDDRLGGDHFGVEHHPPTDLPRKEAEMPIGALHHRRNAEGIMPGLHGKEIKTPTNDSARQLRSR